MNDEQRITLATIGKQLGHAALEQIASIVTPETILGWHRKLVAAKFDTSKTRAPRAMGRPSTDPVIVQQVLRMAAENPPWGYRRITGELAKLGIGISHQTVKNILEDHGIDSAPQRRNKTSWSDLIKSHTDCLLATDFLTTEVWTPFGLVTFYVLFFIHVGTRKVYLGGITTDPNDGWIKQAARNLTMTGCTVLDRCRYLIRDRDTKFTSGFDMILKASASRRSNFPPEART